MLNTYTTASHWLRLRSVTCRLLFMYVSIFIVDLWPIFDHPLQSIITPVYTLSVRKPTWSGDRTIVKSQNTNTTIQFISYIVDMIPKLIKLLKMQVLELNLTMQYLFKCILQKFHPSFIDKLW